MLIQWKAHRKWFWVSFLILLVATGTYVYYANTVPNGPHGGSVPGLLYGIVGTVMMLFAGGLAARKKKPHWHMGSAQFWLKGHLWLGTLSFAIILFHAGFGWGGVLENWLWITFGIVVFSGFLGLFMQHFLPRLLTARVPLETFVAQLPYQCRRMQLLADQMVSADCGKLNIENQPLHAELKALADFGGSATKDELADWPDQVPAEHRGLLNDLAVTFKQNGLGQTNNFPKLLAEIYDGMGATKPAAGKAKAGGAKKSPLEQMKAKAAGGAKAGGGAKPSPLEQMKAKAAAGKPKLSPLEQMKAKAAAKKAGADKPAGDAAAEGAAKPKLSPIEQMRAKAAAKKAAAAGGTPAAAAGDDKPAAAKKSPLELAREQAAAKAAGNGDAAGKKKSPIELAREQAAKKQAAAKPPADAATDSDESLAVDGEEELPVAKIQGALGSFSSQPLVGGGISGNFLDPASQATINFTPEEMTKLRKLSEMEDEAREGSAESLKIPCKECGYELPVPSRKLLGRKARCPMCSFKFILELPEDEQPELMTARAQWVSGETLHGVSAPLLLARQEVAAKKAPPAAATGDATGAKKSPLELAREQASAKRRDAAKSTVKKSPLELAREQSAKKAGDKPAADKPAATKPPAAGGKKMSPLEQMKARKAAAGGDSAKPAAGKPKAKPKPKPLVLKAEKKKKKRTGPIPRADELRDVYQNRIRPFLEHPVKARKFPDLANDMQADRLFAQMRGELPAELHETLGTLENYVEERRQYISLTRIHRALHWWLMAHIPVSMAMFVLMIVHIIVALRVVPFKLF